MENDFEYLFMLLTTIEFSSGRRCAAAAADAADPQHQHTGRMCTEQYSLVRSVNENSRMDDKN